MKMCVITDSLLTKASEPANTSVNASPSADQNTTSWTQLFRKPLKPKLTRKIVTSAKTNLNKYWSKFEEMMASDAITPDNVPFQAHTSTRTSYRLMPPMLSALRRNRRTSAAAAAASIPSSYYSAPPSPPASPLEPVQLEFSFDRNNIADEINSLMAKRFTVEKNVARSSMYKHFTDESLYHGLNLNDAGAPPQRCSCGDLNDGQEEVDGIAKYPFTHRNLSLSFEDKENLENEAMEVYTNLGYEISF